MVQFNLTGLNSEVGLDTSPTYDTVVGIEQDISSAFNATIEISKSKFISAYIQENSGVTEEVAWANFDMNNVFFFKTTDPELTSSTADNDMAFKCDPNRYPDISYSLAKVSSDNEDINFYSTSLKYTVNLEGPGSGAFSDNMAEPADWRIFTIGPARLAKEITGGYNNSDIFANEDELKQQYKNLDSSGNSGIKQKIKEKLSTAAAGGPNHPPSSNADDVSGNIAREVLLHFLNDSSGSIQRVNDMIADASNNGIPPGNTSDLWIPIKFDKNDEIRFRVKYTVGGITNLSSVPIDSTGKPLGENIVTDQEFKIILRIVD